MRCKNRFDPDYDSLPVAGYRDFQILGLIEVSGSLHWAEIQVNLQKMVDVKDGKAGAGGHEAFNTLRCIAAMSAQMVRRCWATAGFASTSSPDPQTLLPVQSRV